MVSAAYVLQGAALHVCLPDFKLNLPSSFSRKEIKTKYVKTIANIKGRFPLLLIK